MSPLHVIFLRPLNGPQINNQFKASHWATLPHPHQQEVIIYFYRKWVAKNEATNLRPFLYIKSGIWTCNCRVKKMEFTF